MPGAKVWEHHLKAYHDKVARDKKKAEEEAEERRKKAEAGEASAPAEAPAAEVS